MQKIAALSNLVAYYCIALPVGAALMFAAHLKILGNGHRLYFFEQSDQWYYRCRTMREHDDLAMSILCFLHQACGWVS